MTLPKQSGVAHRAETVQPDEAGTVSHMAADHQEQVGSLADQLHKMRLRARLASKDLATTLGWAPSKVSRIENGRQRPSVEDVEAWAEACGEAEKASTLLGLLEAAETSGWQWKRRMRHGHASVQSAYNKLVRQSSTIKHFETIYIPGLLQTSDYARQVLEKLAGDSVQDVDVADAVAARLQRQAFLYDQSKRFEFLLAEPVIRWLLCPPETMRAQIDRLQTVIGLPNVRFGIVPMGVPLNVPPQNSFVMYDDVTLVETLIGEIEHTGTESALYARVLDRLWAVAAEGDAARKLLVAAAAALPA